MLKSKFFLLFMLIFFMPKNSISIENEPNNFLANSITSENDINIKSKKLISEKTPIKSRIIPKPVLLSIVTAIALFAFLKVSNINLRFLLDFLRKHVRRELYEDTREMIHSCRILNTINENQLLNATACILCGLGIGLGFKYVNTDEN